jgi:hypothetical protein
VNKVKELMDIVTRFGLVTGFIGLLDTARGCTLQFSILHARTHKHTSVRSHVFTAVA